MSAITRFLRHQSIAVLALLMACGGTSYAATRLAANSVGPTQLQNNAVSSPKVRNGSLVAADLAPGVLGSGRTAPLRKGEVIRGVVTGDYDTPRAGVDYRVGVTFPIPLAAAPTAVFVDGVTPGDTCTGTYTNPTAPPDTLCVYVGSSFNPATGVETHSIGEASRWGFQLGWVARTVGDTYCWARWAYTEG